MTATIMSSNRLRINEAKAKLTIPVLWQMFTLAGKPAKSCRSPFREDRHPSFSVSDDGRYFHDFATGEKGDAIDFCRPQRWHLVRPAARNAVIKH